MYVQTIITEVVYTQIKQDMFYIAAVKVLKPCLNLMYRHEQSIQLCMYIPQDIKRLYKFVISLLNKKFYNR